MSTEQDLSLGDLLEYHLHRAATTGRFSIDIDFWDDPDIGENNRWEATLRTGEDPDSDSGFHWITNGRGATVEQAMSQLAEHWKVKRP